MFLERESRLDRFLCLLHFVMRFCILELSLWAFALFALDNCSQNTVSEFIENVGLPKW